MEAVSEVSEDVTVAWKWLEEKWLLPLLPSLAGEAQNATKDADGLSKYQDCVSWPPQGQCQCLQALQVTIVSHHFTYSQQAKDSWWLLLEEQNMQRSLAHIPGWSCLVGRGSPASGHWSRCLTFLSVHSLLMKGFILQPFIKNSFWDFFFD